MSNHYRLAGMNLRRLRRSASVEQAAATERPDCPGTPGTGHDIPF
jgi:hypothetical protein